MTDGAGILRTAGFALSLAFVMAASVVPLFGLAALAPEVRDELGLSRAQFGLFTATTFAAAALSVRFAGTLTDRLPPWVTFTVLYAGAILAVIGVSLAPSFPLVIIALVVAGFAMAFGNPLTNRLIAASEVHRHRGLLVGIKQSGIQSAQLSAGLILPPVAVALSWRLALDVALVLPVAGILLGWAFALRSPSSGEEQVADEHAPLPPAVWWLTGYGLLAGLGLPTTVTYLPLFGYDDLDLHHVTAGLLVALVGGLGILARIGWGQLAGLLRSPRLLMAGLPAGAGLGGVVLLTAGVTHTPALLWVGTCLFAVSGTAVGAVVMAVTIRVAPHEALGRATGTIMIGQYVGFVAGPLAFGSLAQWLGYPAGWVFVAVSFAATALTTARSPGLDGRT